MNDETSIATPANRSPLIAGIAIILWLIVAGAGVAMAVRAGFRVAPEDLATMATLAAGISAPIAAVVLLAALFDRKRKIDTDFESQHARAAEASSAIRGGLTEIDAMLGSVAARLEALRSSVADEGDGLKASATHLETTATALAAASSSAAVSTSALLVALPEARDQLDAVTSMLDTSASTSAQRLSEIDAALTAIRAQNAVAGEEAESTAARMQSIMQGIETSSAAATAAVAGHVGQLHLDVDAAFDRTSAALDTTRDGVHAQTSALLAAVDQARVALDHIGGEASRAIGKRLDRLLAAADQLGTQLGEQDARSRMLVDSVERSFVMLDGKLQHTTAMSNTTLDQLALRIGAVRGEVDSISTPLSATETAVLSVEALVLRLAEAGKSAVATLADNLPASASGVADLNTALGQLHTASEALAAPISQGRQTILDAGTAFAEQRTSIDAGVSDLAAQLVTAKSALAEIEEQAQGSAMRASQTLIETLARVREVAAASTGAMRTTIEGLVAEAETALERAGTEKVESAFGAPVRAQIAAIETASQAAANAAQSVADRVSQRLLGLTQTVATVEARIDEADARFDRRAQVDLSTRSAALLEHLANASIDLTKRLAVDVGDGAWAAYLKGDRSIFARRAVQLLDRGTARAIARHYTHDAEFRESATGFIDSFEMMLKRVLPDREGKALAVTLVSSDIGKLYVALAQAVERLK